MNVGELPTYIPLSEAARRYEIGRRALTRLVEAGRIGAVKIDGGVAVAEEDLDLVAIEVELDARLKGNPIRVTEAAQRYGVSQATLSTWADKGLVGILDQRRRLLLLDEADVKLAAEIFRRAREATGSSVRAGWILKRTLQRMTS